MKIRNQLLFEILFVDLNCLVTFFTNIKFTEDTTNWAVHHELQMTLSTSNSSSSSLKLLTFLRRSRSLRLKDGYCIIGRTKDWGDSLLRLGFQRKISWNPSEYGNITKMHFPGEMVRKLQKNIKKWISGVAPRYDIIRRQFNREVNVLRFIAFWTRD